MFKTNWNKKLLTAISKNNHADVVHALEKGADPNHEPEGKDSPLIQAVQKNNHDIVTTLLTAGAHINHVGQSSNTALITSIYENHVENYLVQMLIQQGGASINLDAQDDLNNTALIYACQEGNLAAVQMLVEAGADLNIKGHTNDTALNWAIDKCQLEIANYLIDQGANPDIQGYKHYTALTWAVIEGSDKIVKKLIEKKANLDKQSNGGHTALIKSIINNRYSIAYDLIDAGVDIHIPDNAGNNALDYALQSDSPDHDLITHLIEAGADTSKMTKKQRQQYLGEVETPYHSASATIAIKHEGFSEEFGALSTLFNFEAQTVTEIIGKHPGHPRDFDSFFGDNRDHIIKAYEWMLSQGHEIKPPFKNNPLKHSVSPLTEKTKAQLKTKT